MALYANPAFLTFLRREFGAPTAPTCVAPDMTFRLIKTYFRLTKNGGFGIVYLNQ
ncbi:hypothetical protein [Hydrogenibacillus sp. N12]|uniref:hypothetical protein n=1 Tax=Hydrogenibacillus sp. N12 TaxID=2866627 RepID=UPI001C7CF9BC|nr:hypothetical protein [Hydrogenibacillus sp. N12]QZA33376.1 hypothetical protein K2M58_02180 [Hydrogenibacillus sp. N12]